MLQLLLAFPTYMLLLPAAVFARAIIHPAPCGKLCGCCIVYYSPTIMRAGLPPTSARTFVLRYLARALRNTLYIAFSNWGLLYEIFSSFIPGWIMLIMLSFLFFLFFFCSIYGCCIKRAGRLLNCINIKT